MFFYGRENELKEMERLYEDGAFACVVLYGRRRVGKTALIHEFCKDKKTIYFRALQSSAGDNLHGLSQAIFSCEFPNADLHPDFASLEAALEEIGRLSQDERIVFVIDEYPYLAEAYDAMSSLLQRWIDSIWQTGKLYLILCGSSMCTMQRQAMGYDSPLQGRITAQFPIKPMTYREAAAFHPELSDEQNAYIYGITGGVPHYIHKLNVKDSLDAALMENLFDHSAYLLEELEHLLREELRELATYNSILQVMAEGASKLNEIATAAGSKSGPCSKYIGVLIELGLVKKETPIAEKATRKSEYRIADNFFRFWYRFVPRNMSAISTERFSHKYDRVVKAEMPDYMKPVFEEMCKQYLLYYADDLPFQLADVGSWWGTDPASNEEIKIDIVGVPVQEPNQTIQEYLIGSCKFTNEKIGMDELQQLEHCANVFGKGRAYHFVLFSLGGFTRELIEYGENNPVTLVTLADMYAMERTNGRCISEKMGRCINGVKQASIGYRIF
jgi:hypothetical protein